MDGEYALSSGYKYRGRWLGVLMFFSKGLLEGGLLQDLEKRMERKTPRRPLLNKSRTPSYTSFDTSLGVKYKPQSR